MRLRFARTLLQPVLATAVALGGALSPSGLRAQVASIECEGPDAKEVHALSFVGNTAFRSDSLSTLVLTTPSSFTHRYFGWFFSAGAKRCYPDIGLKPDVDALKQYYLNNGYYDTRVDTSVVSVGRNKVDVTFRITEGEPVLIDTLTITGLEHVADTTTILRNLRMQVGARFGLEPLIADVDSITRRLGNVGYPNAVVLRLFNVRRQEHRASVGLDVNTGPYARFGTIKVNSRSIRNGPPEIDSAVVRRLLGFKSGDEYSESALADAQRNLYNLTAYRHVGVSIDTLKLHGDTLADIVVDLQEDYLHDFSQEEGWAILDCFRTNTQYTDKNFLDQAQRLVLTARLSKIGYGQPTRYRGVRNLCYRPYLDKDSIASSLLNYYLGATLQRPTLFGTHWVPSYSAYTERRGEYEAYRRTTYLGLEAAATRNLGRGLPFRAGYTIEFGQTVAQPAVLCALFTTCTREDQENVQKKLRLAIASARLQKVRLDGPVVEPTGGYVLGTEVRGGAPFIGSDPALKFLKTTADATFYKQTHSRVVAMFRLRGGLISGSGSKLPPPQERLYAGGSATVRGFQEAELGPIAYLLNDQSFTIDTLPDKSLAFVAKPGASATRAIPLGGNSQFVFNAELRIRDPFFPDLFEYVPFIDGGQVWTQTGRRSLNTIQRPEVTPGLGFRVFSFVGPIQLNVGYNPHRSRPGPAYFATPVGTSSQAPLICVTGPGVTPVPVRVVGGQLEQDPVECPNFIPAQSSNFFKHLVFTLSIGTGF